MKWSVGTRIGAGYALALFMLLGLGVISYQTTTELVHAAELRSHVHEVLRGLDAALAGLTDAETDNAAMSSSARNGIWSRIRPEPRQRIRPSGVSAE